MKLFPLRRTHFAGLLIVQVVALIGSSRVIERFARLDCPIRAVLGVQCPGCGSTRCVQALGSGDLVAAMRHNPLLAFAVAGAFLYCSVGLIAPQAVNGLTSWFGVRQKQVAWVTVGLVTVFTVGRNMSGTSVVAAALRDVADVLAS
jgi:hypothetical protein